MKNKQLKLPFPTLNLWKAMDLPKQKQAIEIMAEMILQVINKGEDNDNTTRPENH